MYAHKSSYSARSFLFAIVSATALRKMMKESDGEVDADTNARWLVPKMVKNGLKSSFVYWRLI